MKKKHYIILVSVLLLVILDQVTKQYIVSIFDNEGDFIPVIDGFFSITYHLNTGGAFSMLEGQMWLFYFVTLIAFILFFYLIREVDFVEKKIFSIAVILLIAGAIGNFIDRLLFQEVVDFLDFIIFGWDFAVFNVADICLVVGMIFFAYDVLMEDLIYAKIKNRADR